MSPAASRRFRVTLLVARHLTRDIDATTEENALIIAEYLFTAGYSCFFQSTPEDMADAFAETLDGEVTK